MKTDAVERKNDRGGAKQRKQTAIWNRSEAKKKEMPHEAWRAKARGRRKTINKMESEMKTRGESDEWER